jgi:hypothetical protein
MVPAVGKEAMEPGFALSEIDTTAPHPARIYNALLGGKDNYAPDREAVRQVLKAAPEVRDSARANRAFLQRAVRFLVGEAGIRQIIDVGTGIPSAGNVHQVAGQIAPETRVAYVDNDPIVHVHANALLTGTGTTSIVLADLRDPGAILAHPKIGALIDFGPDAARDAAAVYEPGHLGCHVAEPRASRRVAERLGPGRARPGPGAAVAAGRQAAAPEGTGQDLDLRRHRPQEPVKTSPGTGPHPCRRNDARYRPAGKDFIGRT